MAYIFSPVSFDNTLYIFFFLIKNEYFIFLNIYFYLKVILSSKWQHLYRENICFKVNCNCSLFLSVPLLSAYFFLSSFKLCSAHPQEVLHAYPQIIVDALDTGVVRVRLSGDAYNRKTLNRVKKALPKPQVRLPTGHAFTCKRAEFGCRVVNPNNSHDGCHLSFMTFLNHDKPGQLHLC